MFDAGASETGRPYFAMELVRGIKITECCDQANLSTAERLELFVAVTGLTLLGNVLCSPAQTRSFTDTGDLIYRATLNDGSQHIVNVRIP